MNYVTTIRNLEQRRKKTKKSLGLPIVLIAVELVWLWVFYYPYIFPALYGPVNGVAEFIRNLFFPRGHQDNGTYRELFLKIWNWGADQIFLQLILMIGVIVPWVMLAVKLVYMLGLTLLRRFFLWRKNRTVKEKKPEQKQAAPREGLIKPKASGLLTTSALAAKQRFKELQKTCDEMQVYSDRGLWFISPSGKQDKILHWDFNGEIRLEGAYNIRFALLLDRNAYIFGQRGPGQEEIQVQMERGVPYRLPRKTEDDNEVVYATVIWLGGV